VVLAAGRGSRMTDLTSQVPKALLPIGNMPMVWYPINMLERAGFEEAIVLVLASYLAEATKLLKLCEVKIKLDLVAVPDQEFLGTADSLRLIKDKIKRDVLVVSCDLIMDVSLHHLANVYRTYDATVTMLLYSVPDQQADPPVPGPKSKKRTERDFIGFDDKGRRVLFMTCEADLDADQIGLKRSVLKKHPNINIRSNVTDCHLYIIKKWVINYLADKTHISSIKGELIPHLVKKQFSKKKKDLPNPHASVLSEDTKTDILNYVQEDTTALNIQEMSTWIDHTGDMADCYHGDKIRCYAHVVKDGLCVRTNTVGTYCETNKQILKYLKTWNKDLASINNTATIKGKPQIGSDCMVGERTTVEEKVSVKRSVIGKHCCVAEKVKVNNSVIMDQVQLNEGCSIQGCVVSTGAVLGEKCELKDCVVGSGQHIAANSKYTNEALVGDEEMMEI